MSRNKDIKALHDWTGLSYKECRQLMKSNNWILISALIDANAWELPKFLENFSKAIQDFGRALAESLNKACEALAQIDWAKAAEYLKDQETEECEELIR